MPLNPLIFTAHLADSYLSPLKVSNIIRGPKGGSKRFAVSKGVSSGAPLPRKTRLFFSSECDLLLALMISVLVK